MKKVLLFVVFIFLFCPFSALAINMFDVVINEIAWMGTVNSSNDEWMELKNNTGDPIDLSGWTLQTADEKIKISLNGVVSANGFYLLERTDDSTVPDISADQIYAGALSNNGQDIWLYDGNNNIIDEADFYQGWTAGDKTTKQTMERTDNDNWQTSKIVGGTPKSENSDGIINSNSLQNTTENISKTTNIYSSGIFINEILPNPEGSDETNEWIELYNSNDFGVNLSGWFLKDAQGTIKTYAIPKNTKILANGFLVLKRPDTKITLNNNEDGLNLLTPDKKTIDSVSYTKAPLNQSYNKTNSGWQWSAILTPGNVNAIEENQKEDAENLLNMKNSVKNDVEAGLAGISQSQKNTNPWFLFFIALAITITSALLVLFIKFKFTRSNNPAKRD